MLILSFTQHGDVTVYGPFASMDELQGFAAKVFGLVTKKIELRHSYHHPIGGYTLKASELVNPASFLSAMDKASNNPANG